MMVEKAHGLAGTGAYGGTLPGLLGDGKHGLNHIADILTVGEQTVGTVIGGTGDHQHDAAKDA